MKYSAITLNDLENLISEIAKKPTGKEDSYCMIAGEGAKNSYVDRCLELGIPLCYINLSITDNKNGTYTIGPIKDIK